MTNEQFTDILARMSPDQRLVVGYAMLMAERASVDDIEVSSRTRDQILRSVPEDRAAQELATIYPGGGQST